VDPLLLPAPPLLDPEDEPLALPEDEPLPAPEDEPLPASSPGNVKSLPPQWVTPTSKVAARTTA
jgi:hypothetical protein